MDAVRWIRVLLLAGLSTLSPLFALAQVAAIEVVRPEGDSVTLSSDTLRGLPRTKFDATAHEKSHRYEGTDLRDVLHAAGVDRPAESKGALLRRVITAHASDGYVVAFAWAEIDPSIGGKVVWLVDRQDGNEVGPGEGPWRVIVPSESRPARWARQVTRIVVSDAK